ncbi:polysaccharide deacetylase family protein [uncultured Paracoccus sp.]|uniref:polysaccharide deacetylase family protein n=1 Tax=uncultured Paracoccus sp. TaxID=189685 RepID=UPI00260F85A5|nr:polysaccharide deacetylase family protein [uncultured Paracoccus sp.]
MSLAPAKRLAKSAALALATAPVLYPWLRRRALGGDKITILCYHTLGPDGDDMDAWTVLHQGEFRRQIALFRRDYDIVSLDQALDGPRSSRPQLVLTFDDGDIGLYTHLLPILREEGLPVTVYVATGQIADQRPYWFDRVMNALQGSGERQIDLSGAGLGRWTVGPDHGPGRCAAIGALLEALKTVDPDRREAMADRVIAMAAPVTPPRTPVGPMSLVQLQEFAAHPGVTIAAHSHCHNLLDQIPLAEAADSIALSRKLLQDWTGQEVRHFAYPNSNHNAVLRAEMARQGFASATVLDNALTPRDQDRFALSRLNVGRFGQINRLRLRMAGK